jgi:hypothetical protein
VLLRAILERLQALFFNPRHKSNGAIFDADEILAETQLKQNLIGDYGAFFTIQKTSARNLRRAGS